MQGTKVCVAVLALCWLVSCDAAAVVRRSLSMPSSIKSFCLDSWGPQEKTIEDCDAVFLDADLTSESRVREIRSKGKNAVGYISAGTVEKWRSDADEFKDSYKSIKYRGYGGSETWLDITHWESFKNVMAARIKEAADKGFDFLEFDNVDCDINRCVPGISYETLRNKQGEYLNWLISRANSHGMGVGLKNAQSHISDVSGDIAFAINEQCQQYSECGLYKSLIDSGKPVFGVEYNNNGGKVCSEAKKYDIVTKYEHNGWKNCF